MTAVARAYKRYLLGLLLVVLAFNYLDRTVLAVALQDIKVDLALSDTQLGFLSGIAFALFYAVMGIPIARWADRGDRVRLISLTTALWSVMVCLCGLAGSFWHLLVIRIGVAIGEAGCVPPANSLIADAFTRAERPRAAAIYLLGGPLSVVVGYFLAGWLNEFYGWRATFVILGLPGIALAALVGFTLREPRREGAQSTLVPERGLPLGEVMAVLWSNRTFRHVLLGFSVMFFFGTGIWQWQPAYFVRSYGMQTGELGTWFAICVGIPGILGTIVGGELASRIAVHNERLQLRFMAVGLASFAIVSSAVYVSPNAPMAFALVGLANFGAALTNGPLLATLQTVVPARMRAIAIAVVFLFANLIGMGLGPLAAGALSDVFRPWAGEDSLRYALLTLCPGYFWAGWHLWRGSRTVMDDLRVVHA